MAVTIHNTPQAYTPSDNPVNWTFSSDMTAEDNFVFLVEVYINDVLSANELVFPDNGINGRFDAKASASNACAIPQVIDELFADAVNYAQVKIKVIERYGIPVIDHASTTTANIFVWKSRLEDDDFIDWDSSEYVLPGADKKWLTNFPDDHNRKVKDFGEQQRLMAITNNESPLNISFRLFDSDDVLIASALSVAITVAAPITIFNVSPEQIVADTSITQPDFDSSAYYTIDFSVSLPNIRIDIDRGVVFDHRKRIHFLSEIGAIESFTFELISRPTGTIKSSSYRKIFGQWNNENFEYTKQQGRDVDFAKVAERKLIIESDWLFETIQHWLHRNLFESPVVYEELTSSGGSNTTILVRRKIMQTAWADKYNLNDTLFKERITLGLPHKTSMIV